MPTTLFLDTSDYLHVDVVSLQNLYNIYLYVQIHKYMTFSFCEVLLTKSFMWL